MGDQMEEWKEAKAEAKIIFFSSVNGGSVEVGALIHKVLVQIFQNISVQTVEEEKSGFGGGAHGTIRASAGTKISSGIGCSCNSFHT